MNRTDGRAFRLDDARGRYIVFLKNTFPRELTLEGLPIVVDCANGAAYRTAPETLRELGATVIPMGCEPNGLNINEGCRAVIGWRMMAVRQNPVYPSWGS